MLARSLRIEKANVCLTADDTKSCTFVYLLADPSNLVNLLHSSLHFLNTPDMIFDFETLRKETLVEDDESKVDLLAEDRLQLSPGAARKIDIKTHVWLLSSIVMMLTGLISFSSAIWMHANMHDGCSKYVSNYCELQCIIIPRT